MAGRKRIRTEKLQKITKGEGIGVNKKAGGRGRGGLSLPFSMILIFALAVVLPSGVLGLLALRAADREAAYVERSLEAALLAEVNLAAQKISVLLEGFEAELGRRALMISGPGDLDGAFDLPAPAALPFYAAEGRFFTPAADAALRADFMRAFGAFLEGWEEVQQYDSVAGVYRKEMGDGAAAPPREGPPPPREEHLSDKMAPEEEGAVYEPHSPAPFQDWLAPAASPLPPSAPKGAEMQKTKTMAAADPSFRDRLFKRAEEEGFTLMQRNVAPQAGAGPSPAEEERSATVARGITFPRLLAASEGGFLPKLTDRGLELIYWTRSGAGASGFFIDMEALKDSIAGAAPDMLTDVRLLAVLDDGGEPLADPPLPAGADWRRPFVAREISPLLPRWEVGAWLSDPGLVASRARLASIAVWALTGALLAVIVAGAAAVLRMVSAEMDLAAQKTTFVANVSHELKTPLTSIRLFAEMLLSGRQKDEGRRKEYLTIMVSEAERLSRLVDDVLAFSRRGRKNRPLPMESLDLAALAEETFGIMTPRMAEKGFAASFSSSGPLPVRGNGEALGQIIMNLLSNSEKYSRIIKEIAVRCASGDGQALVEVADRGPGIDPALGERIFQEFFRVDDSLTAPVNGAGLGLAIARAIAREHGGDVRYRPRRGGGSVFILNLPLSVPEPEEEERK